MDRIIKFEYGFESVNGVVKKVYHLHEIPNIEKICDVWNMLPIKYVRQFTGLKDKNGKEIFEGDYDNDFQVVHWCEKRSGWAISTYDFPTKEHICCHCYSCEGDFEISELIDEIEIAGNIHQYTNPCQD